MSAFISGSVVQLKFYLVVVRGELNKIMNQLRWKKIQDKDVMCRIKFLKKYGGDLIVSFDAEAVHGLV